MSTWYTGGMLLFNHALAGAAVGAIVPLPLVAPIAFATHFLLDVMPHAYGEKPPFSRFWKIQFSADIVLTIIALGVLYYLFPENQRFIIGLGAFFGMLPDCLWLLWKQGPKWLDKFLVWASMIQWAEWRHGWILDLLYGATLVYFLALLAKT
jgi:hypothetical protein